MRHKLILVTFFLIFSSTQLVAGQDFYVLGSYGRFYDLNSFYSAVHKKQPTYLRFQPQLTNMTFRTNYFNTTSMYPPGFGVSYDEIKWWASRENWRNKLTKLCMSIGYSKEQEDGKGVYSINAGIVQHRYYSNNVSVTFEDNAYWSPSISDSTITTPVIVFAGIHKPSQNTFFFSSVEFNPFFYINQIFMDFTLLQTGNNHKSENSILNRRFSDFTLGWGYRAAIDQSLYGSIGVGCKSIGIDFDKTSYLELFAFLSFYLT
ncbi:hypothetical protein K8I28_13180 [bacterium]|nr:hypothetical protein [bacterium]